MKREHQHHGFKEITDRAWQEGRKEVAAAVTTQPQYQSDLLKTMLAQARAEGHDVGVREGHDTGLKEGRDVGLKEGRAAALLMLLRARGLSISKAIHENINHCRDIRVLDVWLRHAVHVQSAEALVGMEYEYQSDSIKRLVATAREDGRHKAIEELRPEYQSDFLKRVIAQATVQGRDVGVKEGHAEGRAEAVLLMLKARSLSISKIVRQAVARCSDIRVLDLWIRQALHVQSAEQLLDGVDLPDLPDPG